MRRRVPLATGFTLVEVMVVTVIFATIFVLFGETFTRTEALHSSSSTHLRAEEDSRLSIAAIGKVLRGAEFDSIVLYRQSLPESVWLPLLRSPPGPADEIRFKRIADWTLAGTVLGNEERIFWRPSGRSVNGVAYPGEVVWRHDGTDVVLCSHVPSREYLTDSNGDGDWDAGEAYVDTNGTSRWDPGFAVIRWDGQVRVLLTSYATASDRTIDFVSAEGSWTLRN